MTFFLTFREELGLRRMLLSYAGQRLFVHLLFFEPRDAGDVGTETGHCPRELFEPGSWNMGRKA